MVALRDAPHLALPCSAVLAPIAAAVAAVTGVGEGQVEVTASAASVLLTVTISGFETKADAAASLPKFAQARGRPPRAPDS